MQPLVTRQDAGKAGGRGNSKAVEHIKSFGGGTSADYLARRIARDRPDVLARMKAGEFPYRGPFCYGLPGSPRWD